MRKHLIYIIFFICLLPYFASTQSFYAGLGIGTSNYDGEFTTYSWENIRTDTYVAGTFYLGYTFNKYLETELRIQVGKVSGEDRGQNKEIRNLSFRSPITDISWSNNFTLLEFDPIGDKPFSIYATAGLSVFKFNPYTDFKGDRVYLQKVGTAGQYLDGSTKSYSLWSLSIPVGGGLKWRFHDAFSLNLRVVGHYTFTDNIDDIGKSNYVDFDELSTNGGDFGGTAAQLANRAWELTYDNTRSSLEFAREKFYERELGGNLRATSSANDLLFFTSLSVTYHIPWTPGTKFGNRGALGCPTF